MAIRGTILEMNEHIMDILQDGEISLYEGCVTASHSDNSRKQRLFLNGKAPLVEDMKIARSY